MLTKVITLLLAYCYIASSFLAPKSHINRNVLLNAANRDSFNRPGVWDDPSLDSVIDANRRIKNRLDTDDKKGNTAKILWIESTDSKIPPHEVIDESPNSVFTYRNIANQVNHADVNCMSVIQYAVDVLKVKHIVVCGNYDCGGVRAAMENIDHQSPLENSLIGVKDVYRLHMDELKAIRDPVQRSRRLVELNTIEQCVNVYKSAVVQRRRVETYDQMKSSSNIKFAEPRMHAFVYEPKDGELIKLDNELGPYLRDLRDVYDVYSLSDYDLWEGSSSSSGSFRRSSGGASFGRGPSGGSSSSSSRTSFGRGPTGGSSSSSSRTSFGRSPTGGSGSSSSGTSFGRGPTGGSSSSSSVRTPSSSSSSGTSFGRGPTGGSSSSSPVRSSSSSSSSKSSFGRAPTGGSSSSSSSSPVSSTSSSSSSKSSFGRGPTGGSSSSSKSFPIPFGKR